MEQPSDRVRPAPEGGSTHVDAARPKAVLVVDDVASNVMLMRAMLAKAGYEPHVARSGAEGIELAHALRPDLVLMDIHMPGMDGFEAAKAIRANDPAGTAPIIAVTANASAEQRAACERAGFAAFLLKPLAFEELVGAVRRLLD